MTGTGVIDQFLDTFTRYIDSGFGLLGSEVGFLCNDIGCHRYHACAPASGAGGPMTI